MESKVLAENICKYLSDKKAHDVVKIFVADKTVVADYFIIAGGTSTTQVKALCDNLTEYVEGLGVEVRRTEGVAEGRWAVVDLGDVIVHVFNDEQRLFYHLERIWGEGERFEG
ncbi:MAG: ribosome silencing factor [Clostridia bacterium]|nr:ribosome silencing factor [Clostridia bacterium]